MPVCMRRCAVNNLIQERDEAVAFIRVIGEELVNAGFPAGDRAKILANLRLALANRKWLVLKTIEAISEIENSAKKCREFAWAVINNHES